MSKQSHLYLPMQISSQEFKWTWESSGCATDVLLLHTARTLQKTNIPYLRTNIHLKADLGGEGQKLHEGYIYRINEKLLSGTDLTPSQNTFPSLTHTPLQGFSACSAGIHHWWPWQDWSTLTSQTAVLLWENEWDRDRDQDKRGRVSNPTLRHTAEQSHEHPRQQQTESEHWRAEKTISESRGGQYSSSNKCDYKSFLSLTYSHALQCFSNSTMLTIAY